MNRFQVLLCPLLLLCLCQFSPPCLRAVSAEELAVFWDFDMEGSIPLAAHGGVQIDVPGPRPPIYPDFSPNNTAAQFDGNGARLSLAEPAPHNALDFTNGDAITLEAWVNIREINEGAHQYIIGKGRTGQPGFARDNQNWALRIRGRQGKVCVNFLFATAPRDATDNHWHRWTTQDGFIPGTGWHHVAVSYKFGEPESIRGWIDGQRVPGLWDMGGATRKPPVVDNGEVWIGSSMGGSPSVSFHGGLDRIAVHRTVLDEQTLSKRYHRVGEATSDGLAAEVMPALGDLPADRVVTTFHEGMPAHDRWLREDETWPDAVVHWEGASFLLNRLPIRYDDWGIRDSWKAPVAVRLAADVELPAGKQSLLLRARGLSRVWVDGHLVARTQPLVSSPNGEEPITPLADPPAPGLRAAGHRLQEVSGEVEIKQAGPVRVVLEAMAGGKQFRPEPGELTLALRTDNGRSYQVLRPLSLSNDSLPLTDQAVQAELGRVADSLTRHDDEARRTAAATVDGHWRRRHQAAKAWVEQHPAPDVPETKGEAEHPIDAFIRARIDELESASGETSEAQTHHFHTEVLPILRNQCFRCHGEKDQGDLRLDSRQAALTGGFSGTPAVQPGDPHASELIARLRSDDPDERMPPTGKPLPEETIRVLEAWITQGAPWPELPLAPSQTELAPLLDDAKFLRRAYLDTVGVVPTEAQCRAFLADRSPDKRAQLIDRLLEDPRWADHWISYWQDLLAENPTLINATLNSTGPFRWFLYDALRDDKPLDRMTTELLLMRGSTHDGGSAGFALAAQNDSPFAAKGHVVASAFLGIEMQCARCHDSPYHSTTQRDLYSLAAMFARDHVSVPQSSTVPAAFFESKERESLIQVTLKPDEPVDASWPFTEMTGAADDAQISALMQDPQDTRERLATLITAPQNTRFAQVMANRLWRRLIGAGIVEPPHDWEGNAPSHGELLDWLAKELVANDYSVKHLTRIIMNSRLYQQEAVGRNLAADAPQRLFNAPDRRRMTAEQIVDAFYAAAGQKMNIEEMTLDPDGRRPSSNRNTYGQPHRSWMLVSLSNERDRPSLTLPRAAMVEDVLVAFGWSGDRQAPRTDRESESNVRQPATIANSHLTHWLTKAAHASALADLAVAAETPETLVESIFLRFLSRLPTAAEQELFVGPLAEGFADRLVPADEIEPPTSWQPLPQVTWSNHLRSQANTIQQEHERRVRMGPPADPRLQPQWRELYEDFVWSVVNLREFVWMP